MTNPDTLNKDALPMTDIADVPKEAPPDVIDLAAKVVAEATAPQTNAILRGMFSFIAERAIVADRKARATLPDPTPAVREAIEALCYARPLLMKYAHTQGNREDFVREIIAPVDAALAALKGLSS